MAVLSVRDVQRIREGKLPESVKHQEKQAVEEVVDEKPRIIKPKANDPWYYLQHPDYSPSNQVTCNFNVDIDNQSYKVEIERGRVETQYKMVKDELVRRGYIFMNEEF